MVGFNLSITESVVSNFSSTKRVVSNFSSTQSVVSNLSSTQRVVYQHSVGGLQALCTQRVVSQPLFT